MRSMKKLFLISLLALSNTLAHSAEVDQFTTRHLDLKDASELVNLEANRHVRNALARLENIGCDEDSLYKELRKAFANHKHGELTIHMLHAENFPRHQIALRESVYADWNSWDGFLLGRPSAANSPLALGPLVNIDGIRVGTDKFEHIFGRGFMYFKRHYLKGHSLKRVFKFGIRGEKTLFGGNKLATGVFSYADLSANFNGMRFWNHMLQLREDVMGDNHGPYISCQDNRFVQVKEIDFRHYIDESMDESINCSKFATKKTMRKFVSRVEALGYSCPIAPEKLEEMRLKYGALSHWIINEDGPDDVSYFGEFR